VCCSQSLARRSVLKVTARLRHLDLGRLEMMTTKEEKQSGWFSMMDLCASVVDNFGCVFDNFGSQ
jgi:hypothetical protein